MKCKIKVRGVRWNPQVKYKGGMVQIYGDASVIKPLSESINGTEFVEVCNGEIKSHLLIEDNEVRVEFQCERCGKFYHDLGFTAEGVQKLIDEQIKLRQ